MEPFQWTFNVYDGLVLMDTFNEFLIAYFNEFLVDIIVRVIYNLLAALGVPDRDRVSGYIKQTNKQHSRTHLSK